MTIHVTHPNAGAGTQVWTVLLTNIDYVEGAITLAYSLQRVKSAYPLVVLYTDSFPAVGIQALNNRDIRTQHIEYIRPANGPAYSEDPRFLDCWTKLVPFSLTEYDRIVQLDADMLVLQNMDELMTLPLDSPEDAAAGRGTRVMAAGHACCCNPLKKKHYPTDWVPENCAFTTQHNEPDTAHIKAPAWNASPLEYINGGLQVVIPSDGVWNQIVEYMQDNAENLPFADQSVLSSLFRDRWVELPYIYNALKTLRWEGVHDKIWRDDKVKNIHYILTPKPWHEKVTVDGKTTGTEPTHQWWVDINVERKKTEKKAGVMVDDYNRE